MTLFRGRKKFSRWVKSSLIIAVLLPSMPVAAQSSEQADDQIDEGKAELIRKIDEIKREIADRSSELERERDRNGKLIQALLGSQAKGCFASVPLTKLEIVVRGGINNEFERFGGRSDSRISNEGDPYSFTITLGRDLGFSAGAGDLFRGTEFASEEGSIVKSYEDRKVSDIETIVIKRNGVAYDNQETTRSCGFLGTGRCTAWYHGEHDRFILGDLKILVNDEVLYEKAGFSHIFDRNNLELKISTSALQTNTAYNKLLSRQDCVQTQ